MEKAMIYTITLTNGCSYNLYGCRSAMELLKVFDGRFFIWGRELPKDEAISKYEKRGFNGNVDFSHDGEVHLELMDL